MPFTISLHEHTGVIPGDLTTTRRLVVVTKLENLVDKPSTMSGSWSSEGIAEILELCVLDGPKLRDEASLVIIDSLPPMTSLPRIDDDLKDAWTEAIKLINRDRFAPVRGSLHVFNRPLSGDLYTTVWSQGRKDGTPFTAKLFPNMHTDDVEYVNLVRKAMHLSGFDTTGFVSDTGKLHWGKLRHRSFQELIVIGDHEPEWFEL